MGFQKTPSSSSITAPDSINSSMDHKTSQQIVCSGAKGFKSASSTTKSPSKLSLSMLSRNVVSKSPRSFIRSRGPTAATSTDASSSSTVCLDIINAALELGHAAVDNSMEPKSDKASLAPQAPKEAAAAAGPRRVYFDMSYNQDIPSSHDLSDEDIESCWWSKNDSTATFHELRDSVVAFRIHQQGLINDFIALISHQCNQSTSDVLSEEAMQEAIHLVPMELRGCEIDIAPLLKVIRRKQIMAVVECSKKIPKHLDPALQQRMLSARSVNLSRPLKVLATVVGRADEQQARLLL
jgi:hypothetical protein